MSTLSEAVAPGEDTARHDPTGGIVRPRADDDIVLVDDDEMIAEFVRRVLRGSGRELRVFDDPLAALAHLETRTARVLVVDTCMPRLDGPGLIAALARIGRPGGERVILCSASRSMVAKVTTALPATVERLSKDELFDRHTLLERLGGPAPITATTGR